MLYIVGLGLGDEKDITLRGLGVVRSCDMVYVEAYTSLLSFDLASDGLSRLQDLYGRPITVADREMVEEKADEILSGALSSDVAFLVVGDPFGATTLTDLVVRAKKLGVKVEAMMNAVGVCGLQLYHYGETVSIPFFTETWRPDSFYEKIRRNRQLGLHTLCLLDIRVKEPSLESLCRIKIFMHTKSKISNGAVARDRTRVVCVTMFNSSVGRQEVLRTAKVHDYQYCYRSALGD